MSRNSPAFFFSIVFMCVTGVNNAIFENSCILNGDYGVCRVNV